MESHLRQHSDNCSLDHGVACDRLSDSIEVPQGFSIEYEERKWQLYVCLASSYCPLITLSPSLSLSLIEFIHDSFSPSSSDYPISSWVNEHLVADRARRSDEKNETLVCFSQRVQMKSILE